MNKVICLIAILACVNADFSAGSGVSGSDKNANKVHIHNDNRVIAGMNNGTVLIYDTDYSVKSSLELPKVATAVDWSVDLVAIVDEGEQIKVYDTNTWSNVFTTTDSFYQYYEVTSLAISYDAKYLAIGCLYYIDIYLNDPTWTLSKFATQANYVHITSVAFSLDNNFMVSTSNDNAMIWQQVDQTWNNVQVIDMKSTGKTIAAFNNDYLAISQGDHEIYIYSTQDWTQVNTLQITGTSVFTGHCSFDQNKYLAVSTQDKVVLFNTGSWSEYQTITPGGTINDMEFSNDKLVISHSSGTTGNIRTYSEGGNGALHMTLSVLLFVVLALLF